MSAEDFIADTLDEIQGLSPDLRKLLLEIASLPSSARVRELQKALQEAAHG
jgi:hypothetical protein